jgi:hypothetical protein
MKSHRFTLILSGVSELTPDLSDALFEATGGDIECNMRDGVPFLEFDRTALSLQEAINSAIQDVEGAHVGVRVARVEAETANSVPEMNSASRERPDKE